MSDGPGMDRKSRADSYYRPSDLPEAVVVNRGSENAPEVVSSGDYLPEVAATKPDFGAYKPYTPTTATAASGQVSPSANLVPENGQKQRKILGVRRRFFFIACVVAVIIIAVAVAVPVALTTRTTSQNSVEPDTEPDPDGSNISLDPSAIQLAERPTIAATNYTADGVTRLYVFSQAANNSLLVSLWDTQNTTWSTLDLSALFDATRPDLALSYIPNNPIAGYSYMNPTFQMRLYALVSGNSIREMVCTDPTLKTSWVPGRLGFETFLSTAEGSRLAALRPQCGTGEDCRNRFPHMAVAFESAEGDLIVAKSPQFRAQIMPEAPAPRTEIGLAAVMKKSNVSDLRWHLAYRAQVSGAQGRMGDWASEGSLEDWATPRREVAVAQVPAKCFTTFTFDLVNIMELSLRPSSGSDAKAGRSVTVSVMKDKERVYSGTLTVEDTAPDGVIPDDAQFEAVSGSAERRVYGVIGGRIHEWQFDYSGASTVIWTYVGPVT